MTDWSFWEAQLRGEKPETTPGTPHAGYYRLRKWASDPTRPGKRTQVYSLIAIWDEDGAWHCLTNSARYTTHLETIDHTFSLCCRNAITVEEYEAELKTCARATA